MNTHKFYAQSGNVFFIILLAIGLFASLAFVVSQSARNENTTAMTEREARLAATDIVNYASRIERAVNRLRQKGVSENDISFDNGTVSGYAHSSPKTDTEKVFRKKGGGARWKSPADSYNDGSDWFITGKTCINGVGKGGSGCSSDGAPNEELLLILSNLQQMICENINIASAVGSVPTDTGTGISNDKYVGVFADDTMINIGANPRKNGCFQNAGAYYYYHTLIAR